MLFSARTVYTCNLLKVYTAVKSRIPVHNNNNTGHERYIYVTKITANKIIILFVLL